MGLGTNMFKSKMDAHMMYAMKSKHARQKLHECKAWTKASVGTRIENKSLIQNKHECATYIGYGWNPSLEHMARILAIMLEDIAMVV